LPVLLIDDVMTWRVVVVTPETTVFEAETKARRAGVHRVVVAERDRPLGVACRCDLGTAPAGRSVGRVMNGPAVVVQIGEPIERAVAIVRDLGAGCVPVVDASGRLRGIVTRRDLRALGLLCEERGVNLCGSCGTSHGLGQRAANVLAFCSDCLERSRGDVQFGLYDTLGDGG
jgi:signal-transduction protein with cAMP-binding, CBS, and nucleotidyltransferase domain